jgi:3,4-dihydroxy-2-butanone 4-phosphate synthase
MKSANVNLVLEDIKKGIPVIIVDDHDRENEADLVVAAEKATKHNLLFLMNYGKGLMCIPCEGDVLDRLEIPQMIQNNNDKFSTPFSLSVDAVEGTTTGMSVFDRLKTIEVLVNEKSTTNQLAQPGHLFPLRAHPNLLQGRRGHTEASVELVKHAGLKPISIIVEIVNNDGTMLRGPQVLDYANMFNLKIISVQEIYDEVYKQSI